MRLVIVLPTYNERGNIQAIVAALVQQLLVVPYESHILVVDDNSPDGTGDLVRGLARQQSNLHLISGEKRGLGAAYIRGMNHALEVLLADIVVEMDADFSHDPADLPRLLKELEAPADFVIGSRYVAGGSIPASWSWQRRATSRIGNVVARYIAGLHRVRDCTAGYRAIRGSILRQIDFGTLRVKGYAFQIALLHQAVGVGARVREIPVRFIDRRSGESKLGLHDVVEFLINAWWIRLWNSRIFVKFCLVGITGVLVNLGVFSALISLGMNQFGASPIAVECSIVWNFLLNDVWTFRHRPRARHVGIRGLRFNVISFASLAVTFVTFVGLSQIAPARPRMDQLISIIPASALNYFLNSYWAYKATPGRAQGTSAVDP